MRRLLILALAMLTGSSLLAAQKHAQLTERRDAVLKSTGNAAATGPVRLSSFLNYASPPWQNWQNWQNWTNW